MRAAEGPASESVPCAALPPRAGIEQTWLAKLLPTFLCSLVGSLNSTFRCTAGRRRWVEHQLLCVNNPGHRWVGGPRARQLKPCCQQLSVPVLLQRHLAIAHIPL